MEKELKKETKLIDLIKNQLDIDEKNLIKFIDFKKNNEEIIQNLVKCNILNFGDSQNYVEKNC
jgi:acetyl-CoA carboxylase beta subunit